MREGGSGLLSKSTAGKSSAEIAVIFFILLSKERVSDHRSRDRVTFLGDQGGLGMLDT